MYRVKAMGSDDVVPAASSPAELLRKYRALCEASALARISRAPLANGAAERLASLEQELLNLLTRDNARADEDRSELGPRQLIPREVDEIAKPAPVSPRSSTRPGVAVLPEPVPESPLTSTQPDIAAPPGPAPDPVAAPSESTTRRVRPSVHLSETVLSPTTPEAEPPPAAAALTATIFTDGSAEGNPGPGGYCAIVRIPGRPDRELSGSSIHTTNNKMELAAAIAGLKAAVDVGATDIAVVTDSEYLVKGMTNWLAGWIAKGWKTAYGQAVKNRELWEQLAKLAQGRQVRWEWVRGHAGHPENERCDAVATANARQAGRARPT